MSKHQALVKNFQNYSREDLIKKVLSDDLEKCTLVESLEEIKSPLLLLQVTLDDAIKYLHKSRYDYSSSNKN